MRAPRLSRALLVMVALLACLQAATAFAGIDTKYPELRKVFPEATRFGDIEGTPPAAAVYHDNHVIGYAFETVMVAPIPAYSGKPINVLVAIGADGSIRATRVLYQDEPILLVGIPVQKLYDFVARYIGHHVQDHIVVGGGGGPGTVNIDAISGATVTAMVANDTIMNSALEVAASRKLVASDFGTPGVFAHVRTDNFKRADWAKLTGNGSIAHLRLTRSEVAASFNGEAPATLIDDPTAPPPAGHGTDTFIDLYFADVTPPTVGRNLLGESAYGDLMRQLKPGDTAVALMANGIYSFKGLGYVRGGVFDRVHLLQDGKLTLFKDRDLVQVGDTPLEGKPAFTEQAIFIAHHGGSFDATQPWTLQLLVRRQVGPLDSIYHTFTANYRMPAAYINGAGATAFGILPANAPMWMQVWYAQRYKIAVLVAGLGFLLVALTFQDWLTKRKRLFERVRVGFLIYTLVFIGWYGLAQLSVVNILTFIHSVLNHFTWNTFLMDPMVFILWTFVAVMLLLFGRGIYCGWLCPFGALQELVSRVAKKVKVPQLEFPPFVHERMWAIKYIILLGLVGVSLQSVAAAERLAEVEPFKTAIILHFARSWAFVAYAVVMIAVSAVNERFYCRYVCPLGGGLAVSGKFHLFEWLRRRKECGHPCQICAVDCPVKAIDPLGKINYNECVYCLECQVDYNDAYKCPPLVQRRKVYERAAKSAAVAAERAAQPAMSPGINHPVPLRPPQRPAIPKAKEEDATP
ncbi:MAG TPA: 4Fe-4S binding protein [Rhodanobacteraceae bacterium]|nr:4Fe-4S binding protein [Rhodanobacteraceae bacterium]